MYYRGREYTREDEMFKYLTYSAYVIWGLAGIIFILGYCLSNSIRNGISVFKTVAQFVMANLKIFSLPLIFYLDIGLWYLFWIYGAYHVISIGTPIPREDDYSFFTEVK